MNDTTVLIVGDYRQTLAITRALKRRSHRVIAGVSHPRASHIRTSRKVDELWLHPPVGQDTGFADALDAAIEAHRPDVIFPVGDLEIRWFGHHSHAKELPLASVDLATADICQDKPGLLKIAGRSGVAFTKSRVVSDLDELRAVAGDLGYPYIIKSNDPLRRVLGSKGIICRSAEDPAGRLRTWPDGHQTLILQEYLEGPRHNLYFAAHHGHPIGIVEVEILRTDRLDGTGYAVDGITRPPNPDLLTQTRALMTELSYQGVGCTQFLVAPGGETSFLELNPRLGANFVVADAAGLDLAGIAVDLALDRPVTPPDHIETGLRYAWGLGELAGLRRMATEEGIGTRDALRWLGRTLSTAVAADVHVTWSIRDPIPSLALLWRDILKPMMRRAGQILRR